jgi:hypothetical protein
MATIEPHHEKKFRFRVRVTVKVTQKERRSVAHLSTLLGCGKVRANRTTFDWIVRDQAAVQRTLLLLQPYLKTKHQQCVLALRILATPVASVKTLMQVARLADSLSRLNVRSTGRRKNFVSMIQVHFSSND